MVNWAHVHIAINHLPVIGIIPLIALLALGMWRKNRELERASLELFVALALLTIPVYLTGSPASKQLQALGVPREKIHEHSDAGDYALAGIEVLGALSLGALIKLRRQPLMPTKVAGGLLVIALVVLAIMARTAQLGGKIRHPEIGSSRPGSALAEAHRFAAAQRYLLMMPAAGESNRSEPAAPNSCRIPEEPAILFGHLS